MKVFVVTSHIEHSDNVPETIVEGVAGTKAKAQEIMKEAFTKLFDEWPEDIREEEDIERTENATKIAAYDPYSENYLRVEIWEEEVEY